MSKLKCKIVASVCFLWLLIISVNIAFAFQKYALLLQVTLNQKKQAGIFECYEDQEGNIFVNENDLAAWHFPPLQNAPMQYLGKNYYSLKWYKAVSFKLNKKELQISISVPSHYFPKTDIDLLEYDPSPIRPTTPGLFLNYDITSIQNDQSRHLYNSVLFELGLFNQWGVGTNDMLVSNFNEINQGHASYHFVRLNTQWTLDQPEKIASLRFGDTITGASNWSGSARFGGIQYATNFNTQPNFITFPLPGFKGEAIVPTNLQIFVNGVLNQRRNLDNGAYSISNIPVVTGAGTVNVVSQDLLGRTQVISLPYYASPTLLKAGLNDYSYEMGLLRENYGLSSNQYSQGLVVATYQRGMTESLTAGTHVELLTHQQTMGVSADYLYERLGIFSLATAQSHSGFGRGFLQSLGFTRQSPTFNFGIKSTYMSVNYQQIGIQTGESGPLGAVTTQQVFVGYDAATLGSFGLSYTLTKLFAIPDAASNPGPQVSKIGTVTYSRGVSNNSAFSLSMVKDFHNADNNQYYASFVISLDDLHSLNAYANHQNGETQPAILYTRNLPIGDGYGYHILATNNGLNGPGGDFTYQNEIGTYSGKAYHIAHKNYYEADVSGAMGYFDHQAFLSRRMTQSFALVEVPGYENVRIYYQNQVIGRTNHQGNLLVPELLPYQKNTLGFEPRDLPLTAAILNTTTSVQPYYRSGLVAKFEVNKTASILLHLRQSNGEVVPVGSDALLANQLHYLVGYEGILFLPVDNSQMIKGEIFWANQHCRFEVILSEKSENSLNGLRSKNAICS